MSVFSKFYKVTRKFFGKTDDAATLRKGRLADDFVDDFGQHGGSIFDPLRHSHKTQRTTSKVARSRTDNIVKGKEVADTAKSLPLFGTWKNSLVVSGVVLMGYATWKSMSVIGVLSEAAEETINNFFGINCESGDADCQEKGAKNMLLAGLLVTAGVGGLVVLSLKKDSQEPVASS